MLPQETRCGQRIQRAMLLFTILVVKGGMPTEVSAHALVPEGSVR